MLKKGLPWVLLLPYIAVHAGTSGIPKLGCQANGVASPCRTNAWELGVSALYLQPSSVINTPAITEGNQDRFINPPSDWGFDLEGSYYFNKGSILTIDWLNFSDKNSDFYTATTGNDTYLSTSTKVNIVNAELGQQTRLGEDSLVRLFAGVQYASIKDQDTRTTLTTDPISSTFQSSNYSGAGPRLGADFSRELPHGFNAFAQGAMSLLIGDGKGKQFTLTSQSVFNHHLQMVPSLDAKLGLGYQINMEKASFNVMGGWMFQRYFDAVLFNDNKSIYAYSLNGPYIKAKWTSFA